MVGVGRAGLITGEMVKPGAVVIDCGINVLDTGKLGRLMSAAIPCHLNLSTSKSNDFLALISVGDVDFECVKNVAGFITPVPGGMFSSSKGLGETTALPCISS